MTPIRPKLLPGALFSVRVELDAVAREPQHKIGPLASCPEGKSAVTLPMRQDVQTVFQALGEWLPKYAPQLNLIERSWRDLKPHRLAHRTFRSVEELDTAVETAVDRLNHERRPDVCHDQRIAA